MLCESIGLIRDKMPNKTIESTIHSAALWRILNMIGKSTRIHTPPSVDRDSSWRSPIKYYRTQNHSVFKINWKVKTCRHQRKSYVQSWIRLWMQFSFTTATIVDSHWLNIVERDIFKESIKGIRWTVLVGHTSTDTRIMPRFIGLHQFDTLFKRNHPELLSIWKVCLLNQYYN